MKYYSKLTGKTYPNKGLRTIAENKAFAAVQGELQEIVNTILAQLGAIHNARGVIRMAAVRKLNLCRSKFAECGPKGLQMWEDLKKDAFELVQTNGLAFEQARDKAKAEAEAERAAYIAKQRERSQQRAKKAVRAFL